MLQKFEKGMETVVVSQKTCIKKLSKVAGATSLQASHKDTADKADELYQGAGELKEKLEDLYGVEAGLNSTG